MATGYIPSTDSGLSDWLLNFATLIAATPAAFGLVASDATAISAQNAAYQAAYTAASDPSTRTSATVAAKDVAKTQALAVVRPYAVQISLSPAVTADDKVSVGVTVRKTVPTPVPPPSSAPALLIQGAMPGQTTLGYRDPANPAGKAKPFGVTHVQVFASQGTVPGVDPEQATYLADVTKSPFTMDSSVLTPGKTITMWARYKTRSGSGGVAFNGPWSSPLVFIAM